MFNQIKPCRFGIDLKCRDLYLETWIDGYSYKWHLSSNDTHTVQMGKNKIAEIWEENGSILLYKDGNGKN